MTHHRWPKRVYKIDKCIGKKCWVFDVKRITTQLHLPDPETNVLDDLGNVQNAAWSLSMDSWWKEALQKVKLRTYVQVRARNERDSGEM